MYLWSPVSSNAYGPNAVYIPEYGKSRTLEFILVMTQNYPEYKTHPALDVFHGYTKGIERFEENHEMRVLGWEISPEKNQWSFLCLPTMRNDIKAVVTFSASPEGRMRMEITMKNPSEENRQWEFHLYVNPCEGLALPDFSGCAIQDDKCRFSINGIKMTLQGENISFWGSEETDSNFWINFPLNAETCEDPSNPKNRYKKRLKIRLKWLDLPAGCEKKAAIDFFPDSVPETAKAPAPFPPGIYDEMELPWRHMLWEAYHNRQYTRSFENPERMIIRHLPSRQWGKFFIWDCGMTAVALADFDKKYTDEIIAEMPDPALVGEKIFQHGSFIVTAIYALWELYRESGNIDYVSKHYDKLTRLALRMFDTLPGEDYDGLVSANRGTGADDSPALFYSNGFIFAWEYKKTLPINASHEKKSLICIGMTAHGIRQLKILRVFAYLLDKQQDIESFTDKINTAEKSLNEKYWSEETGCYLDRVAEEKDLLKIPWIYDYLPLFSGSSPQERAKIMFEELMAYLTTNGFTPIKPDSPYYRREGYPNGSIWPPLQYLFWKACVSMGQMEAAREIAARYFHVYEWHHKESLCCCEHYRAETGKGEGNMRFSGFVTPIIAMHKAHHSPGAIQTGYETIILKRKISQDTANITLMAPFFSGKTGFSIVMKPEKTYLCRINGKSESKHKSDKKGWLGLAFNIERQTELSIEFIIAD